MNRPQASKPPSDIDITALGTRTNTVRPTMLLGQLLTLSASLLCSVALLTGCAAGDERPDTAPTDNQSSASEPREPSTQPISPTTSATTDPPTEKEQAALDAEGVVRDYVAFADQVIADRKVDLSRLDSFLQDPELTEQRDYFDRFRDQGFYSEGGSTTFEWIRPTKVRVDAETGEAAITLRACRNVDDLEVRSESGDEVDTLSPSLGVYQVFNYDYPNASGWRIAIETSPGKLCEP